MAFPFPLAVFQKTLHVLQRPGLLFYLLIYLMVLLIVGTVAQKEIGLYQATHLFFNRFFYWIGPLPIPVGASVLGLLFVNLAIHFITKSQWNRRQFGTTLAHLSILLLLLGGAVTLLTKKEGFIILRKNETVDRVYDYHDRRFTILKDNQIVYSTLTGSFKAKSFIPLKNLPFTIRINTICANCTVEENQLKTLPKKVEDETNQLGFNFQINLPNGVKKQFSTTEFSGYRPQFEMGGHSYQFVLHRENYPLPFSLLLLDFTEHYYAGTDIAKQFTSSLSVIENNQAWPVLISMNNPFRYRNYTLYQSSVLTLPGNEKASVMNVVNNSGWLFPYLATFLLFAGLSLHFWVRSHDQK